jgi:predicted O-methyltransferase YrrM
MPDKFTVMTPAIHAYIVEHGARQDDVLRRLAEETAALGPIAGMQIAPEQGALLTLLARSIGARRAIEIGTFTGYSAISIARGLGEEGGLLCCDVNEEWTAIARRYFREAGLENKIELKIAPALETLRSVPQGATFDFGFIDADKESHARYYEEILERLRPGGLIVVDNVLWGGSVVDPTNQSGSTRAIRALNDHIAADQRVDIAMVPVADGIMIVRKR